MAWFKKCTTSTGVAFITDLSFDKYVQEHIKNRPTLFRIGGSIQVCR
jgi:hypothetical protein